MNDIVPALDELSGELEEGIALALSGGGYAPWFFIWELCCE
jgi:hypothetical protein